MEFSVGDLVWAKMKGFPAWPASITSSSTESSDIPTGKYGILFFGTHETAFMKPHDLSEYFANREAYEKPSKFKGFNEGVEEIREAAAKKTSKAEADQKPSSSTSGDPDSLQPTTRTRKRSTRYFADDFLQPNYLRSFANTRTTKKSFSGQISANDSDSKKNRSRASSISSRTRRRSKRISYSDKMDFDLSDIDSVLQNGADPTLFTNVSLSGYLSPFESADGTFSHDEKTRSRRRTKSKMFDEFLISPNKSPRRDRSGSLSSTGCRSRLISGFSETFEDLLESAHSIFNPNELMAAIDQLPSEESDRPITPEEPLPMPAPLKKCYACGCQCEQFGLKWRCTSKLCLKWNGIHEPFPKSPPKPEKPSTSMAASSSATATLTEAPIQWKPLLTIKSEMDEEVMASTSSALPLPSISLTPSTPTASMPNNASTAKHLPSVQSKNKFGSLAGVASKPSSLEAEQAALALMDDKGRVAALRRCGRPRSYKVEKTPPVGENGIRNCVFCNGQVRPQMCGGNKHRWRCVDKKCRKWYGWVKSSDEIPKDLGKKGRWKDLVIRVQGQQMAQLEGQFATNSLLSGSSVPLCENDADRKSLKNVKKDAVQRAKRTYTRRKGNQPEPSTRPVSPLSLRQMSYQPSAVERRGRWWVSEKRRADVSPEREFGTSMLDVASSFRLIGNAMLSAAATKADEPGAVNGSLDLLMDSLMASMAPLLTMTSQIPGIEPDKDTLQKLWNASSVHTPMF